MSTRSLRRLLTAACAGLVSLGLGCWEQYSNEWFPQMKWQEAVQAYEEMEPIEGRTEAFTPPEGTVPVDSGAAWYDVASLSVAEQDALPNPVAPTLASLKNGEELYQSNCASCHGPEGMGDGPVAGPPFGDGPFGLVLPIGGPSSVARNLTDGHIFTTISIGRGRMPAYRRIPIEERWDVVNYVRELNGQGGRQ